MKCPEAPVISVQFALVAWIKLDEQADNRSIMKISPFSLVDYPGLAANHQDNVMHTILTFASGLIAGLISHTQTTPADAIIWEICSTLTLSGLPFSLLVAFIVIPKLKNCPLSISR